MNIDAACVRKPLMKVVRRVRVHQKTDRAEIHSENGFACIVCFVKRLKHRAVSSQDNDRVGFFQRAATIFFFKLFAGGLRLFCLRGEERDFRQGVHALFFAHSSELPR